MIPEPLPQPDLIPQPPVKTEAVDDEAEKARIKRELRDAYYMAIGDWIMKSEQ